jgi:peroxiredoxin
MGESPEIIRQWRQANNLTYDLIIDEQQTIAALYRLRGQPSTYILAPDGIITALFFGPVREEALVAALNL